MGKSAWMFEEWPERTYLRDRQLLSTARARFAAVIFRSVKRWLPRKISAGTDSPYGSDGSSLTS